MCRNKWVAALLACLLLLAGCSAGAAQRPQYENPIQFYYCRSEAVYSSETGAVGYETVELGKKDITVDEILSLYFSGPITDAFRSPFPDGLVCERTTLSGGVLTLYLNDVYGTLSGVSQSLASACLTLTLTQLSFVTSVCIETSGMQVTAQSGGPFTPEQFVLFDASAFHPERTVPLYFCGRDDGLLYEELRTVSYTSTDQLPQLALQALLAGPQSATLDRTIPEHTQLIDLSISGGECLVVFSESLSECDTGTDALARAVRPVIATLCAFDAIEHVRVALLDGSGLEYLDISQSYSPEPSWFAQP